MVKRKEMGIELKMNGKEKGNKTQKEW